MDDRGAHLVQLAQVLGVDVVRTRCAKVAAIGAIGGMAGTLFLPWHLSAKQVRTVMVWLGGTETEVA